MTRMSSTAAAALALQPPGQFQERPKFKLAAHRRVGAGIVEGRDQEGVQLEVWLGRLRIARPGVTNR